MTILLAYENDDNLDPLTEENTDYTYLQKAIKKLGVGRIIQIGTEKKCLALEVDTLQEFLSIMSEVNRPFFVHENWRMIDGYSQCANVIAFS